MKSGYKILWTDHALSELENTVTYLEENRRIIDGTTGLGPEFNVLL